MTNEAKPRIWDDRIPESERQLYAAGGHGVRGGLGAKPAMLVVDVTYAFTGDRSEPVELSVERFPLSCGAAAWDSLPRIKDLIDLARSFDLPVIYTKQAPRSNAVDAGAWSRKNPRVLDSTESGVDAHAIHDLIAPKANDTLILKDKPSAFFGTSLVSTLNALGVDSLIVGGTSTSGCVRATVVDAFSLNYPVVVVEEAVFDRSETSHKVALFEINAKYGDVMSLAELTEGFVAAPSPTGADSAVRTSLAPGPDRV